MARCDLLAWIDVIGAKRRTGLSGLDPIQVDRSTNVCIVSLLVLTFEQWRTTIN